jgi:hypothetical protein
MLLCGPGNPEKETTMVQNPSQPGGGTQKPGQQTPGQKPGEGGQQKPGQSDDKR